jgi:hypothetical protein
MLETEQQFRFYFRIALALAVIAGSLAVTYADQIEAQAAEPALEQTLARFYEEQSPVLTRCQRQVFGPDAARLPDRLLRLEQRPALDFARSRVELSRLRRDWLPPGRLVDGLPVPPPQGGPFGTILVVAESHPRVAPEEFLRTYVHELGNLLDYYLHPEFGPHTMRHYGSVTDPSGDDDTGQQFERCVDTFDGFSSFNVLARR